MKNHFFYQRVGTHQDEFIDQVSIANFLPAGVSGNWNLCCRFGTPLCHLTQIALKNPNHPTSDEYSS